MMYGLAQTNAPAATRTSAATILVLGSPQREAFLAKGKAAAAGLRRRHVTAEYDDSKSTRANKRELLSKSKERALELRARRQIKSCGRFDEAHDENA